MRQRPKLLSLRIWVACVFMIPTMSVAAAADQPTRYIDVVEITWPGADTPAVSAADVERVIKTDTIDRWRAITNGQIAFTYGQTLPRRLITLREMPCDASSSISYMASVKQATYAQLGIQDQEYRYLVILSPRPRVDCIWDGRGLVNDIPSNGGLLMLKNNAEPEVIAHELGHNLGLGHSNLERCANGRSDGPWTDCSAIEYGSATDLMSNNDRSSPLAAYHQWRLGLIPDDDVAVPRTSGGVELQPINAATGVRAMFLRDKTAAYWVEYRPADPANEIGAGLVLYRSDPPPGASVESPIASDKADPTSDGVTRDVWMINLDNYSYSLARGGTGSPSLRSGQAFTTAFGGVSLSATETESGTARVTVSRAADSVPPSAPVLTPKSTWTTPDAELLTSSYQDDASGIAYFELRLTSASGVTTETASVVASKTWTRTFLNPLTPSVNLRYSQLPEGTYELSIRGIDGDGNASPWSEAVPGVRVDHGYPAVSGTFRIARADERSVGVSWVGATDKGSGICTARTFNEDGFSFHNWYAEMAGVAQFTLPRNGGIASDAEVFDCLGNGVVGRLSLTTTLVPGEQLKKSGRWRVAADGSAKCLGNCSLALVAKQDSALVVREGTGSIYIDGKLVKRVPSQKTARAVVRIDRGQVLSLRTTDLRIVGLQTVTGSWMPASTIHRKPIADDESLADATQRELSKLGFSQRDFIDSVTVRPLNGGTSTDQPTIDLCGNNYPSEELRVSRRQVQISGTAREYIFVSTETVRYRDAAAVRQALRELDANVGKCRTDGFAITTSGAKEVYAFLDFPELPAGLVPANDRRVYLVNIGEGKSASTLLAAYQFRGNTLNAMYVVVPGHNSLTTAERQRWLRVAEVLAARLSA